MTDRLVRGIAAKILAIPKTRRLLPSIHSTYSHLPESHVDKPGRRRLANKENTIAFGGSRGSTEVLSHFPYLKTIYVYKLRPRLPPAKSPVDSARLYSSVMRTTPKPRSLVEYSDVDRLYNEHVLVSHWSVRLDCEEFTTRFTELMEDRDRTRAFTCVEIVVRSGQGGLEDSSLEETKAQLEEMFKGTQEELFADPFVRPRGKRRKRMHGWSH